MKKFALVVLLLAVAATAEAAGFKGTLLNEDDPWIVLSTDGTHYKREWYGGNSFGWRKGERVVVTKTFGFGSMVGTSSGKSARVYVDEIR